MGAELRFLGSLILVLSNCFLFQLSQFHFLRLVVSRQGLGNLGKTVSLLWST